MTTRHSHHIFVDITFGVVVLASILATTTAYARMSTPVSVASATPDPTVCSLQNVVATQQVEIQTLKRDLAYEVRDIRWWFFVAGVIAAITGFTGYRAYRGIGDQVRKRIRVLINKHYYQLDVTNLDIHIRKDRNLERLEELLKNQGLYNISWFERLGKESLRGITVFPITDESDEKEFSSFMQDRHPDPNPRKAGFILYAPTGYRINQRIIDLYPATAVANTPWNLLNTLMVLGRNLTPPPNLEDDDDQEG